MTIKFRAPEVTELRPRITVLGVGGAGGNAVNNMIDSKLEGVEFVVANTDAQALHLSKTDRRIQMGARVTEGLGAGARPEIGRAGAEESLDEIMEHVSGSHMVFITAGMGGGTGTGAAPVIARAVREQGILTVGVITKPFAFEGDKRMRIAERGIEELQAYVDTLIVIPNQNLFRIANERTTFAQAFTMADEVLHSGVRGVTDLIVMPGLINLDFADIKTVMGEMGKAMMGTGEAEGDERALRAAESAISNPLLDEVSMKGARGVLINITGGPDMMLFEVDQAANRIRAEVDPDANIIFGGTILENMEGRLRVSVVATGIDAEAMKMPENVEPLRPRIKPVSVEKPAERVAANPVRRQVEALSDEFNTPSAAARRPEPMRETYAEIEREPISPAEPMILSESEEVDTFGNEIPPMPAHLRQGGMPQAPVQPAPVQNTYPQAPARREPAPQPRMEEQPKRRFGFLGRKEKKAEPRYEPAVQQRAQAPQPSPRATAQVMTRQSAADQARAAQQAQSNAADDLFPDHKKDDQFEIPAFLRRQTN